MFTRPLGTLLIDEVNRFQATVRMAALAIVDVVIRQELQRRIDALKRSLPSQPSRERTRRALGPPASSRTKKQARALAPKSQIAPPSTGRRTQWTRETIVTELAAWLASGTTIDASFVSRYGPPGLVTATRKIFGRFDATLNIASLQIAKLYPDGPHTRRT